MKRIVINAAAIRPASSAVVHATALRIDPQAMAARRADAKVTITRKQERRAKVALRDPAMSDYTERGWFEQQVCREAP